MKNKFIIFCILFFNTNFAYSNEVVSLIQNNWDEVNSMSGNFLQTDSDGITLKGKFYFLKPYQAKFLYDDRSENIITNKSLLRIVDEEGYQIDSYPIGNNIIKKLLSKDFEIDKEFKILEVIIKEKEYQLKLGLLETDLNNHILLSFDKNTMDLKKWAIYEEFGDKTVLEFTKIKKNIFISQNIFAVKYK